MIGVLKSGIQLCECFQIVKDVAESKSYWCNDSSSVKALSCSIELVNLSVILNCTVHYPSLIKVSVIGTKIVGNLNFCCD